MSVCVLPTLPSGNLEEWIVIHSSKPEGCNLSLAISISSTASHIDSEVRRRVGTGRRVVW